MASKSALGRTLWFGLLLGVVQVSTVLAQEAGSWSHPLGDTITMCKVTDHDMVVASTEKYLTGLDLKTGATVWTIDGFYCYTDQHFGLISNTTYAVAVQSILTEVRDEKSHATTKKARNRLAVIDYTNGKELWNSDALNAFSCIGHYPLPQNDAIVICVRNEDKTYYMVCAQLQTGELIWENREFFGDRDPEVYITRRSDRTLTGNQPPVCDSEETMITFMCKGVVQRHNLKTGDLIWETELKFGKFPTLEDGYPPMMLNDERSVLFIPSEKLVSAINCADGRLLWQQSRDLRARIQQIRLVPQGLLVKGGANAEGKGGRPFVNLLSPATGEPIWKKPFTELKLGKTSDFMLARDSLVIYSDKKLYSVCIADGSYNVVGENLNLEAKDNAPASITMQDGNYLFVSAQNVMAVDVYGNLVFHTFLEAPGTSFLLKAVAFTASLALNTFSAMYMSVPVMSAGTTTWFVYPAVSFQRFPRYGNSVDGTEYLFVLANVEALVDGEVRKGPGIAKIRKADGEIVSRAVLGDKSPVYSIDASERRLVYIEDEMTINCRVM